MRIFGHRFSTFQKKKKNLLPSIRCQITSVNLKCAFELKGMKKVKTEKDSKG